MSTRTLSWTVAVLALLGPTSAFAADQVAESLYQDGRRALAANDLDLACRKFAESQARESAPGTLLNLGDCEERRGHLVLARESFEKAVAGFLSTDSRLPYAKDRLERIDKRVPRLTVHVRGGVLPDGARIVVDGAAVVPDVTQRLDRGAHSVVLVVPGRADTTTAIDLAEGESREVDLSVDRPAGSVRPVASDATVQPTSERSPTVRALMWGAFGLAVAGTAVGVYGGIRTIDAKSTVDDNCKPGCNPIGGAAQDDGRTWGTVGTVGFIVGGVALAAGVGLLLFGKTTPKTSHAFGVPRGFLF